MEDRLPQAIFVLLDLDVLETFDQSHPGSMGGWIEVDLVRQRLHNEQAPPRRLVLFRPRQGDDAWTEPRPLVADLDDQAVLVDIVADVDPVPGAARRPMADRVAASLGKRYLDCLNVFPVEAVGMDELFELLAHV